MPTGQCSDVPSLGEGWPKALGQRLSKHRKERIRKTWAPVLVLPSTGWVTLDQLRNLSVFSSRKQGKPSTAPIWLLWVLSALMDGKGPAGSVYQMPLSLLFTGLTLRPA